MNQIYKPIETELGIISGRDAIYLDDVQFSNKNNVIRLSGEINGSLCSHNFGNREWIKYSIKFSDVLGFQMIELDFADFKGISSFDEVVNSEWILDMKKMISHQRSNQTTSIIFSKHTMIFLR